MTEIEMINSNLAKVRKNELGLPAYRIVWSDSQQEMRRGTFREFVGNIFIRETVGIREVPKYSYIKERWILERWAPPDVAFTPEIPGTQFGSFEPIYVFQDKNGNYLPPNLKVAEFLVKLAETPTRVTAEERIAEEMAKEEKEIEFFEDYLEVSPITNALHLGEAVGYSGKKKQ